MRWCIGDVHGMLEPLERLLLEIHKTDKSPEIYCTGDYCDRGPDTKGVVDCIIREGIKGVRGNHDDIMDCILSCSSTETTDDQTIDAPLSSLYWFLRFGMYETFGSYRVERDEVDGALQSLNACRAIASRVPEAHRRFFHDLPYLIDAGDFFVAHASIVPELPLEEALTHTIYKKAMIWGRFTREQIDQEKAWGKFGYFGHTPTKHYGFPGTPIFGNNCALIDTGAVFGDRLTAVCHETKEVVQS